jgi:cardiolipin synthase
LTELALPLLQVLVAAVASAHAVLHKRDVRAAIGWVGLIWLVPFAGSLLYAMFGINRIRRRAAELRPPRTPAVHDFNLGSASLVARSLAADCRHLAAIARLLDAIELRPLTVGNRVSMLIGGSRAYDAMLTAIEAATRTIGLATYIFDDDACGREFVAALGRAAARGVDVRVLIDGVGAHYSRPPISRRLRSAGVATAEFLPTWIPLHLAYANLRSHRKILVVDGRTGFTGGMNIRYGHLDHAAAESAVGDIHFHLDGPVVGHLTATFAEDWHFTTEEPLHGEAWFPSLAPAGPSLARGIAAGPDETLESIRWAILAALSQARRQIRIVTPYFLPDTALASSLVLAAMRGVEVDIVLPSRNNLILVQWASQAKLAQLLARGCRIWHTPPPFDHAKLMTVDGIWTMVGSANWDQRSLRLNFEFNVEVYDQDFASGVDGVIDAKINAARPWTLGDANGRSLAAKLRDGTAWLMSPYL